MKLLQNLLISLILILNYTSTIYAQEQISSGSDVTSSAPKNDINKVHHAAWKNVFQYLPFEKRMTALRSFRESSTSGLELYSRVLPYIFALTEINDSDPILETTKESEDKSESKKENKLLNLNLKNTMFSDLISMDESVKIYNKSYTDNYGCYSVGTINTVHNLFSSNYFTFLTDITFAVIFISTTYLSIHSFENLSLQAKIFIFFITQLTLPKIISFFSGQNFYNTPGLFKNYLNGISTEMKDKHSKILSTFLAKLNTTNLSLLLEIFVNNKLLMTEFLLLINDYDSSEYSDVKFKQRLIDLFQIYKTNK
jgi:hypothetical protein